MSFNWSQTLRTAERHLSRGKITAAIEEYRKLVNWDPTNLSMLNTLGDVYVRAGLNAEATRIFSRVAQGYSHQGFTSKAIALLKKVLRIDPTELDAAAKLAECYLVQGLRGEAVRQYADVAEGYKRAGREDKELYAFQRIAEIDPSNTSLTMTLGERWLREGLKQRAHASFMSAGDEYCRQGDDERALAAYLKARAVQPDELQTLAAIASTCVARGQADNAIPILCESLSRNSSDAELHRILGSTYLSAGRLDDAERTFQTLMGLDGGEYRNLLLVGEKFLEIGDLDRAVEQMDGFVEALIANRNEQEAVDFLQKVLHCDPEHPATLKRLALIFRRLREDFNLAPTLKALADSALRRGDRDEAIEALKELCALEPHERAHSGALQSLGVDAPAIPYAACSTSESKWICAASDYGPLGIGQASRPPSVAFAEFVPVGEIYGLTPFSQQDVSSPDGLREANTGFELVTVGNRRLAERVSMRVPLVVISDAGGWREFTETLDVSEAGLKVKLAHPLAPMTVLRVLLTMTKWPETVVRIRAMNATKGIVRYCKPRRGEPNIVGLELGSESEQTPNATSAA